MKHISLNIILNKFDIYNNMNFKFKFNYNK